MSEAIHATARATVAAVPKAQRGQIAHIDAAQSLLHAADFLTHAAELIAAGAPADSPEVARWVDFGKRKVWQGEKELAGKSFQSEDTRPGSAPVSLASVREGN